MDTKPHIHNGRFYNNPFDSLTLRINNVLRMSFRSMQHALQGKLTTKKLLGPHHLSDWIVKPNWNNGDSQPVITWLGHATFLIQIGSFNIITDPVFYSISPIIKRLVPCPIQPSDLPPIHAILISHNHPDHLDEKSILALRHHQPLVLVPQGDKPWFKQRQFTTVHEMTWGDVKTADGLEFTFLPASHWSGRHIFNLNKSLWGSWLIRHKDNSIYFAGDTAYSGHFATIGRQYKPIDVALLGIGPQTPRNLMFDAHTSAQEAVQGFIDLGAKHLIPMHWGTIMFGLDTFELPLINLKLYWHERRNELSDKVLHIVKFGEQHKCTWQPAEQSTSREHQNHQQKEGLQL